LLDLPSSLVEKESVPWLFFAWLAYITSGGGVCARFFLSLPWLLFA